MSYAWIRELEWMMLETRYYKIKAEILGLAVAYQQGDETAKCALRNQADFFPLAGMENGSEDCCAIIIRRKGEVFLVENTPGGEQGVFVLLEPCI